MKSIFCPDGKSQKKSLDLDEVNRNSNPNETERDSEELNPQNQIIVEDDFPIRTRRITRDYKPKPEIKKNVSPGNVVEATVEKKPSSEKLKFPIKSEDVLKSYNGTLSRMASFQSIVYKPIPCLSSNQSQSEDTYEEFLFDIESEKKRLNEKQAALVPCLSSKQSQSEDTYEVFLFDIESEKRRLDEKKRVSRLTAEQYSMHLQKKISTDVLNEMAIQKNEQPILNNHLEILEPLGKGSFARVYKAWSKIDGKFVALKIFESNDDEQKKREIIREAENEARILEKLEKLLNHQNILKLHSLDKKGGDASNLIIMLLEYGLCSMHDILSTRASYLEGEIINILLEILDALKKSQDIGITNRDIKPKNLILSEAMNSYRVADFGVAVDLGEKKELSYDDIAGTPLYIAPELSSTLELDSAKKVFTVKDSIKKETYDPWKSDVFSLGITVLQMMGLSNASIKILKVKPSLQDNDLPELQKYSSDFKNIIEGLLIKNPDERISFAEAHAAFTKIAHRKQSFNDEYFYKIFIKKRDENNTIHSSIASLQNAAEAYLKVGIFDKNLENRVKIYELYSKHYADKISNELSNALQNLGYAYDIIGDSEKAILYYERSLEMKTILLGEKPCIQISSLLKDIGLTYVKNGQSKKAIEYFEKCLLIEEELKNDKNNNEIDFLIAYTLANMALAQVNLGDNHKAISYYEQSAEIYSTFEVEGRILYDFANLMSNIGIAYVNLGLWEKGIEVYEKSMEIFKHFYGTNIHPSVANTLNNCGVAYEKMGKTKKAMELYEKSIEINKKFHGTSFYSPAFCNTMCNLATSHLNQGNTEEAKKLYEESIGVYIKNNKSLMHPGVGNIYSNLGIAYANSGQNEKAIELYGKSLDIYSKIYKKEDHPAVANTLSNLGLVHLNTGDYDKAFEIYSKCLKIYGNLYKNENHPAVANLYSNIGIIHEKKGESIQAINHYKQSININKSVFSTENHPAIANTLNNMGIAYHNMQNFDEAIKCFTKSLEIYEMFEGQIPAIVKSNTLSNMASAYQSKGKYDLSISYYLDSQRIQIQFFNSQNNPAIANTLSNLAILYEKISETEKARNCFFKSLSIYKSVYGSYNHPNCAIALRDLVRFLNNLNEYDLAYEYEKILEDVNTFLAEKYKK